MKRIGRSVCRIQSVGSLSYHKGFRGFLRQMFAFGLIIKPNPNYPPLSISAFKTIGANFHNSVALLRSIPRHPRYSAGVRLIPIVADNRIDCRVNTI